MADNVTANPGTGGAAFATDDDGVAQHPYAKLEWGPDNTQTKVNTGTAALPVQGAAAAAAAIAGNPVLAGGSDGTNARALATTTGGLLKVDDGGGSLTVDNGGTFAVQDSEKVADNAGFTDGTTKVSPSGFIFDEVAGTALTENDVGAARMDSKRALVFTLEDGTTRGTRATVASGRLSVDASGVAVPVTDNSSSLTVDQGTAANLKAQVQGEAAHDASISGNPVRIGGRAVSADYTAVATGDTADLLCTLNGKLVTSPHSIPENFISGATAAITGTSDTSVLAAAGAGVRNYVTQILVTNSHGTVGTVVEIKDGTSVLYRGYAAPAGGGFSITFPVPLRGTANTAINAANVTTGSNTYVSASGFKAP